MNAKQRWPDEGRLTRREPVGDEELAALGALMLGGVASVPGMIAAGPVGALVGVAAAASVFGYTELKRWLHRDGARTFAMRRRIRALGHPSPIGRARPGLRRVEGRIKILEPCDLDGPCAGWWARRIETERRFDGLSRSGRHVHVFEERQSCGNLAIVDETGVAIVVGSRATLWCESAFAIFGPGGGLLRLDEGDHVEVVGLARRGESQRVSGDAPSSYRHAARCLLFDQSPLVIVREPRRVE